MSQSIREENNPVYDTNHPEKPTSLGKNDQNVLYTESTTAEPTRMSTCGQNSSSQGQDRLEATYVAGNEVEHASTNEHYYVATSSQGQDRLEATYVAGNEVEHTTTNEDYYVADNKDIPTPEVADVYSVSDPIHAENSAMYTASGENEEEGNTLGNIEKEQQNNENVMQADSTVNDECDMEPYAVTNMSDHEGYLNTITNVRTQAPKSDSIVTDDGDMEPYAVTNMCDHETYFSGTTSVHQQALDDSSQDTTKNPHKPRNPPNAKELRQNPMYIPNNQQANKLCGKWRCFLVAFVVVLLLVGAITTGVFIGVYHRGPGIQKSMQEVKNLSTLNATELIHVPTIWTTDGTNPPSLVTTDGTTPPNLGTTDGTTAPNLGTTDGTTAPNLGTIDGTTPPNLGTTDGTTAPNLGITTEGTIPPSYKDELIVIHDTFLGRRETVLAVDVRSSLVTRVQIRIAIQKKLGRDKIPFLSNVRQRCQGLQQCDEEPVDVLYHIRAHFCPGIKRYLEVTYHCEAEVKKNITFRKDPGGRLHTADYWGWGAVAVSSTNEIFVADKFQKGIQTTKKTTAITRGRNDTLCVALKGDYNYDIRQYSKEGRELVKFTCPTRIIYGIAWDELSDRIILTISRNGHLEIVRLKTDSPTQACNMILLSKAGPIASYRQSVTVDTKGNIYVIDKRPRSNLLKYGKKGDRLSSFGGYGGGPGNLLNPSGICVDSLGRVFVADPWNSRVEMFTAEGEHIRTVAYVKKPRHLATGGEGQLVIDHQNFVTILPEY
ncbi:hypothetical protein Bbelb_352210 [Branchiostoma belcheri]|nr:hypothetical protein Bbelb_352210 [Branchiostoma belcheri]